MTLIKTNKVSAQIIEAPIEVKTVINSGGTEKMVIYTGTIYRCFLQLANAALIVQYTDQVPLIK